MSLIYIEKVSTNRAAFETKVIEVCKRLGIDPNWLMAVMWIESDLSTTAYNQSSGASGILQFLPSTASDLGTTTDAILRMSNLEQLDLVYKYLKPYKSKIKSFTDCYFAVFFPAALGQYADYILQSYGLSASYVAGLNPGYDANKNNEITFREVERKILLMVDSKYRPTLKAAEVPTYLKWDIETIILLLLAVALLVGGGLILYKNLK